jgi:hypothetical protein
MFPGYLGCERSFSVSGTSASPHTQPSAVKVYFHSLDIQRTILFLLHPRFKLPTINTGLSSIT